MDDTQRSQLANQLTGVLMDRSGQFGADKLLEIYRFFGGAAIFEDRADVYVRNLGVKLLEDPDFPTDEYLKILSAGKLTRSRVYALAHHRSAYGDPAVFQELWAKSRSDSWLAIYGTETLSASRETDSYNAIVERLPMVHSDSCDGENHYWCFEPRLFHADLNLERERRLRERILSRLHPEVLETIHSEILSMDLYSRERYGSSPFVADSHWSELLVDKRPVLNSVALNALLPEELAQQIVATHKTASLRESIARNTVSESLLDEIWKGTKSESIRRAVAGNAVSGKYLTHPELLLPVYFS